MAGLLCSRPPTLKLGDERMMRVAGEVTTAVVGKIDHVISSCHKFSEVIIWSPSRCRD